MMTFMNDLEKQLNSEKQFTENGAVGYRTSGKELLNLNFAVSSMRNWDERITEGLYLYLMNLEDTLRMQEMIFV